MKMPLKTRDRSAADVGLIVHDELSELLVERSRGATVTDGDTIYQRIMAAIMAHRLTPGRKLVEERLATVFGVSRTVVRQALARLAHEMVVTLIPKRGAFVASPTVEEARDVFEARQLIEPALVRRLATSATAGQIARLWALIEREEAARRARDRHQLIRLSGAFHLTLAEMAGNALLARQMRELTSLTCLVIILYDSPAVPACPEGEHRTLVEAIAGGDAERAAALMRHHLDHVERSLDIRIDDANGDDLETIFA